MGKSKKKQSHLLIELNAGHDSLAEKGVVPPELDRLRLLACSQTRQRLKLTKLAQTKTQAKLIFTNVKGKRRLAMKRRVEAMMN